MCLILLAWQAVPGHPLVLAANRDEYYRRPTLDLAPWQDHPDILGGRDLEAGGGWLACHRDGRFAAVTNVREGKPGPAPRSRGELVGHYLAGDLGARDFAASVAGDQYGGFNLLLGDRQRLVFLSNRNGGAPRELAPGLYGLSNHSLETPWPKLVSARAAFAAALPRLPDPDPFFALLADTSLAPDQDLPQTGVSLDAERMLSAIFVRSADYGTRASTLVLQDTHGGFAVTERSFGSQGVPLGERRLTTLPDAFRQSSTMSTGV